MINSKSTNVKSWKNLSVWAVIKKADMVSRTQINPAEFDKKRWDVRATFFSWPLPPPNILKEYNNLYPGCAKVIIGMAVRQGTHRQSMEKKIVEGQISQSERGQKYWLAIGLFGLVVTAFLWYFEQPELAWVIWVIDLWALVTVFVTGKRSESTQKKKEK